MVCLIKSMAGLLPVMRDVGACYIGMMPAVAEKRRQITHDPVPLCWAHAVESHVGGGEDGEETFLVQQLCQACLLDLVYQYAKRVTSITTHHSRSPTAT